MFAIYESYKAGQLQPKQWVNNITAGLIVGVVALPLAMAFAIASGVKPEQGIYTAIIAGIIVSLFGGSRVQIACLTWRVYCYSCRHRSRTRRGWITNCHHHGRLYSRGIGARTIR